MINTPNIYSKENIEFVAAAKEYLVLLENSKNILKKNFVEDSLKILTMLYFKSLFLTNIDFYQDEITQKFVNETHWAYFQNLISEILGEDDEIVQVQDINIISDADYFNVPLSELFADVYQEMGDLIASYRIEDEELMASALQFCAKNFYSYWGIRVIELLKHLHTINNKINLYDV